MLKKILCGFLAVAMMATAFAGCSSSGASSAGGSESGSGSADGSTGGETNLRLALWDYDTVGYDKVMVEEFEKQNPDIKVEVLSLIHI